ncbi:MAG: ankyrin repeat domain-containing protein [Caldilineaceae bacterium]|nr:ankyrin repeat domain-containing protein [Caldilineaceae bacterium]
MINIEMSLQKSKMALVLLLTVLLSCTATILPLGFANTAAAQEGDAKSETALQSVPGLQACQEGMALSQGEGCHVSGSATTVVVGSTSACLAYFEPALLLVCHSERIDSSTVLSASRVGDSSWIIDEHAAIPGSCGELHEIHDTVRLGRADWVSCLAATDVEMNACDDDYATPLSIAAEKGSSELVQILVAAGADANVLDGFGDSPLHIAQRNDAEEVVEVLVAAGAEGEGLSCLHAESVMEADEETEMLLGFLLMYVFLEESGELDAAITEMSQEVVSSLAEVLNEEGSDIETQALGDTSLNIVIEELVQITVKYILPVLTAEGVNTGLEDEVTEFLLAGMSEDADLEAGIAELQNIGFFDDKTADAITAFVRSVPAGLAKILVAASAGAAVEEPVKTFSQSLVTNYAGILVAAGSEVDPAVLGQTPLQLAIEYIISETLRLFLSEQIVQILIAPSGPEADNSLLQVMGLVQKEEQEEEFRIWGDFPLFDAIEHGDPEIVRLLINTGADINAAAGFGGNTALHEAVAQGSAEIVQVLVDAGADIDAEGFMGRTPLTLAAEEGASELMKILLGQAPDPAAAASGDSKKAPSPSAIGSKALFAAIGSDNVAMVKLLVEAGADVNADEGFGGNTPLHEAVEEGNPEIVQILVDAGADIEAEGFMGRTPLSLAAEEGATEIMQILLGQGADNGTPEGEDKQKPAIGSEALFTAIEKGDVETVRLLVEAGADVNADEGFGGNTPLHEAVEEGNPEIVQILVDAGADIEAEGFMGRTPLSLAAEEGATEIMQILLGQGADNGTPEGEDKQKPAIGSEALFTAIEKGDVETVRLLVEAGADVNADEGFGGNTPLHEAVEEGNPEIVQILVDAGADIEAEGFMGRTPLSLAAEEGATEIMQILLGQGADNGTPEGEDKQKPAIGSEALFTAIEKGDVETVRLLVEAGADVNADEGFGGNTPLHEAVEEGNAEIVQILVDAGADIQAEGFMGRTPLTLASEEKATEIMRILLGLAESTDSSGE